MDENAALTNEKEKGGQDCPPFEKNREIDVT
jgi:hypothetical protein